MRILFTFLAISISASLYGQNNMLLHEATRDSLLGEPDREGYIDVWEPASIFKGFSEVSFEFAFFTAIDQIISVNGDTTFVQQSDDPSLGRQKLFYIEYALNNSEGDTVKLNKKQFIHSKGFNTQIEIISDNTLSASYSSAFHHFDLIDDIAQEKIPSNKNIANPKSKFEAKMDDRKSEHGLSDDTSSLVKQNNIISPDYYLVNMEMNLPSDGISSTDSYLLSTKCNFKCLTSKLHEVNMDFSFLYKGGYNVWLHE